MLASHYADVVLQKKALLPTLCPIRLSLLLKQPTFDLRVAPVTSSLQPGIWQESQKLLHSGRPAEQNVWIFTQGR